MMTRWIKKIHMYLGLVNLSIVLVFGIAGLLATLRNQPGGLRPRTGLRFENYKIPESLTGDREVAEAVRARLNIPAVGMNVQRDKENNLRCAFYTHNGPYFVTAFEKESRLEIAVHRSGMGSFFDNLHATASRNAKDWRVQLWAVYNEISIWSLIAMAVSGVYLWLASRPGLRWAQVSFATGSLAFLALYFFSK